MATPFEMAWAVLKGHRFDDAARARPLPHQPNSQEFERYDSMDDEEEPEELDSRHLPLEDELDPTRVHQEEQEARQQLAHGLPDPSLATEDEPRGPATSEHEEPSNPFRQAMSHLGQRAENSVTPDHWR